MEAQEMDWEDMLAYIEIKLDFIDREVQELARCHAGCVEENALERRVLEDLVDFGERFLELLGIRDLGRDSVD